LIGRHFSFSENALKLAYSNVAIQKFSGRTPASREEGGEVRGGKGK
jgi:hypothetical protein